MTSFFLGCAGWNLARQHADRFPPDGTHLQRYACRLNAVEINSSFYRSHRQSTYERWAAATPDDFRFAVKLPKQITHVGRLVGAEALTDQFLSETGGLGPKRGAILVQLPPSLEFELAIVSRFFRHMRQRVADPIICEPRHASWFGDEPQALLKEFGVGRVAADPSLVAAAAMPGGCNRISYFRWHGSPRMYYSSYDDSQLAGLAKQLLAAAATSNSVWCIFDNTALGAASANALKLQELLALAEIANTE